MVKEHQMKKLTRQVFVKHGCPGRQQSQNMAKISKSYILTLPTTAQGHVMSVKCEEPIDEPTVQVRLLFHDQNFKYCTLFVSGTELRTDKRTDDPITRCPRRTFQARGIKTKQINVADFYFLYQCALAHGHIHLQGQRSHSIHSYISCQGHNFSFIS